MRRYVFGLAMLALAVLAPAVARAGDQEIAQQIGQKLEVARSFIAAWLPLSQKFSPAYDTRLRFNLPNNPGDCRLFDRRLSASQLQPPCTPAIIPA